VLSFGFSVPKNFIPFASILFGMIFGSSGLKNVLSDMFFVISFKISERKKTEKLANIVCPNISCKMISSWHKNQ